MKNKIKIGLGVAVVVLVFGLVVNQTDLFRGAFKFPKKANFALPGKPEKKSTPTPFPSSSKTPIIPSPSSSGPAALSTIPPLVISRATDSPSGVVVNDAEKVLLAKFNFWAPIEAVKVESLIVEAVVSEDQQNLNNGQLFVDGVQVGATVDFDSDATDDGNFDDTGTEESGGYGNDDDTFISLGDGFVVPASSTKVLTVFADTKDGDGNSLANNVLIRLSVGGIVAKSLTSGSAIVATSGEADGNVVRAVWVSY